MAEKMSRVVVHVIREPSPDDGRDEVGHATVNVRATGGWSTIEITGNITSYCDEWKRTYSGIGLSPFEMVPR